MTVRVTGLSPGLTRSPTRSPIRPEDPYLGQGPDRPSDRTPWLAELAKLAVCCSSLGRSLWPLQTGVSSTDCGHHSVMRHAHRALQWCYQQRLTTVTSTRPRDWVRPSGYGAAAKDAPGHALWWVAWCCTTGAVQ